MPVEMSGEGTEGDAALYAGFWIGRAILRLKDRSKGPKLAPAESTTLEVFHVIIEPISAFEDGLAGVNRSQALALFLKALDKWRKPIQHAKPDLDLAVPKISSNLFDLFSRLDNATQGKWQPSPTSDLILNDQTLSTLVSWLRYDINQWIIEHS